ncbi:MAG: FKBP-type peptidyl-prolyl cis-trans isomerase [Bacteroidia bacterium]|nr:FKBP-type peptidyl-prolyl cis-trans isomerase [Bacteroidia bacterium]
MIKKTLIKLFITSFLVTQCADDSAEHHINIRKIDKEKLKKQFEYANQRLVQKEIDEMNYFEKTHQMPFIKTNFGVRYYIYDSLKIKERKKIQDGDEVSMNYTISLLDGTICYTDEGKPKTWIVGGEHIESGIHKIMPYLHYGDKAYILIPSALAHGLLGDLSKIPPQAPILYKVEILHTKR